MMKKTFAALTIAAALFAGACAPKNWNSEEDGVFDPLEGFNRTTYKFNKGVDFILLRPAAAVYAKLPAPLTGGVSNVYDNLAEPSNAVNNAINKEGNAAVTSTARFVINSTFGIGGFFDVASALDIPEKKGDFGKTLRGYGMLNTTYIVLPVIGPSAFVDVLGGAAGGALAPQRHIENDAVLYAVYGLDAVRTRAALADQIELAEEIALDEYSFVRDAYEQKRLNNLPATLWGK